MGQTEPHYCKRCACELSIKPRPSMLEIVRAVAGYSCRRSDNILGNSRINLDVRPRYYAMYYMLECGYIQADIARLFNRNHGSVNHATNKMIDMCECYPEYKADYEAFKTIFL